MNSYPEIDSKSKSPPIGCVKKESSSSEMSNNLGRAWTVVKKVVEKNKWKIIGGVALLAIGGLVSATIFVPSMNQAFHALILKPIANWYSHTLTPFVNKHSVLLEVVGGVAFGSIVGIVGYIAKKKLRKPKGIESSPKVNKLYKQEEKEKKSSTEKQTQQNTSQKLVNQEVKKEKSEFDPKYKIDISNGDL